MKSIFASSLLAVLTLSAAAPFASAQNLITNGSFEDMLPATAATLAANGSAEILVGDPYDPVYFLTGWAAKWKTVTVYNSAGAADWSQYYILYDDLGNFVGVDTFYPTPEHGGNAIQLKSTYVSPTVQPGAIYTSVDLVGGESYQFSVDLLGSDNFDTASLWASVFQWAGSSVVWYANGNFIIGDLDMGWQTVGFEFTAPVSGAFEIELKVQGSDGARIYIDNVSLVSTSAVPEPAAFAALAGLGALGCAALRRKPRSA